MGHAITASEYDRIRDRFKQLGRGKEAIATIAAEFGRGVTVIEKLQGKMRI
jgi:hypothetical protein